jgi:hypothetical protein
MNAPKIRKTLRQVAVKMRARCGEVAVDLNKDGGIIALRPRLSRSLIQKMKAGTSKVAVLSIAILPGLRSLLEEAVTTART